MSKTALLKWWAELTLQKRYNALVAVIILALGSVIIYLNTKIQNDAKQYRDNVNSIQLRADNHFNLMEDRLEQCYELRIQDANKYKKDFDELLEYVLKKNN